MVPFGYNMSNFAYSASVYLLVIVSLERYLEICHRHKARSLCTPKNIKICVVLCYVFALIFGIPRFFELQLVDPDPQTGFNAIRTDFGCSVSYQIGFLAWGSLILRFVIPFICLGFFNFGIWRQVRMSNLFLVCRSCHIDRASNDQFSVEF